MTYLLILSNITDAILAIAKSLHWIISTQFLDKHMGTSANFLGEFYLVNALENDVVCPHWVRSGEGRSVEKKKNVLV